MSNSDFASDIAAIGRIDAVPKILDVVCRTTGMGFAAVARVTEDRWIACSVKDDISFGLKPGGELKVETTICNEIRASQEPVVIDHVAQDAVFCTHHTPAMYGFQSYISMPIIRADGTFFGTLCAIDPNPAKLKSPEVIGMFSLFADLIAFHLDAQERLVTSEGRLATSEAALLSERQASELRDQFIAILGHDLRNPLAAIDAGASLMLRQPLDEKSKGFATAIRRSVQRMALLINNVLDFARGRLGGGLVLQRKGDDAFGITLDQVVSEIRMAFPEREIVTDFQISGTLHCDGNRIAQLFSNLLSNAMTHGAPDKPVLASAKMSGDQFELSVTNEGEPIAPEMLKRLFEPFVRSVAHKNQQGLGLGLYIASEIARAHGGRIDVESTQTSTRFTLRAPCAA